MNCPNCGATMLQGPGGGWACGNCGTVRTAGVTLSACDACTAEVIDGPEGGYACGQCGHTVEPPARIAARRISPALSRPAPPATGLRAAPAPAPPPDAPPSPR